MLIWHRNPVFTLCRVYLPAPTEKWYIPEKVVCIPHLITEAVVFDYAQGGIPGNVVHCAVHRRLPAADSRRPTRHLCTVRSGVLEIARPEPASRFLT